MIDVFMMTSMLGRPLERRIFKSSSAKDKGEQFDRPVRLKGEMRKQPMVAERNAHTCGHRQEEKQAHLKPIQTETPEIERHGGNTQQKGSDEKGTGDPVYAIEWNTRKHEMLREVQVCREVQL